LHYYLGQHPAIVMSRIKEPNFFLFDQMGDGRPFVAADDRRIIGKSVRFQADYEGLFPPAHAPGGMTGEASPLYLYTEQTPRLVAEMLPDVAAIAVVRDPVERAWSHFRYVTGLAADAAEQPFLDHARREQQLPDEPHRSGTHHLRLGRYAHQLERWQRAVGPARLLVLDYTAVVSRPAEPLAAICRFLGVDDTFGFDTSVAWNPATAASAGTRRLDRLIAPMLPALKRTLPAAVVGPAARARARRRAGRRPATTSAAPASAYFALADYYADDVAVVRDEWGIDLSGTSQA
jgi:hypothetical protein